MYQGQLHLGLVGQYNYLKNLKDYLVLITVQWASVFPRTVFRLSSVELLTQSLWNTHGRHRNPASQISLGQHIPSAECDLDAADLQHRHLLILWMALPFGAWAVIVEIATPWQGDDIPCMISCCTRLVNPIFGLQSPKIRIVDRPLDDYALGQKIKCSSSIAERRWQDSAAVLVKHNKLQASQSMVDVMHYNAQRCLDKSQKRLWSPLTSVL